jgi:DNA-binding transcriptional LysR family regulator
VPSERPDRAATLDLNLGLVSFELPLELTSSEYRIAWHARLDRDPAHVWLRELIVGRWRAVL